MRAGHSDGKVVFPSLYEMLPEVFGDSRNRSGLVVVNLMIEAALSRVSVTSGCAERQGGSR